MWMLTACNRTRGRIVAAVHTSSVRGHELEALLALPYTPHELNLGTAQACTVDQFHAALAACESPAGPAAERLAALLDELAHLAHAATTEQADNPDDLILIVRR
ncbi:hypothetical protein OHA25_61085 (plasmid) [Nonomuraea sp. NBC_00507]|uniref:hypothetical protein n=1 Tax=Nonomuraea sp. NBC_00507 TaxID=2976002 RepID=UPI002E19C7FB